ncbi:hypothetical protein OG746_16820 [Streptomyces sp. NBC_01016]|nr:hypothetical protein [Streptomyces sp. NBC_01016]MCX4830396.1 hypothetical protein [Streptomyces sp. NBC_01016]
MRSTGTLPWSALSAPLHGTVPFKLRRWLISHPGASASVVLA